MEELDKLKNDWKKNVGNYPKFSEKDIYAMLHKNSSSIVKWILVISIVEFILFLLLTLMLSDTKSTQAMEASLPDYLSIVISVISHLIMLFFIIQFYRNYKKITATDSTQNLMKNILHTRKTVSYYIITNISFIIVSSVIIFIIYSNNDPLWLDTLHKSEKAGNGTIAYIIYFVGGFLGIFIFAFLFWLFYRLIYGLLLKRLHKNYHELKKIDF